MTHPKILILLLAAFLFSSCSLVPNQPPPTPTPAPPPITLQTWRDPAGFVFQYPANLTINNHPEDEANYAHLDLGSVKILMSDNAFKSLADWAKSSKAVDTVLGDKEALKITTADKITLAAIDNDVIVTVEAPVSAEKLFNQITSSFEFFYPTPTLASKSAPVPEENILEETEE